MRKLRKLQAKVTKVTGEEEKAESEKQRQKTYKKDLQVNVNHAIMESNKNRCKRGKGREKNDLGRDYGQS
jgi:hypothetical protein